MKNAVQEGVRGTIYVYTELILSRIIASFVPIILVRNMIKSDYGVYALISSIILIVAYLTSFGLEDIFVRYISEYLVKGFLKRINALFFLGVAIRFFSLLIVLAALFIFKSEVSILLKTPPIFTNIFLLILIFTGINRINCLIGDAFTISYHKRHYVSIVRLLREFLKLGFFAYVILILHGNLYHLVLSMVIYTLIEFIIYAIMSFKKIWYNYKQFTGYQIDDESFAGIEYKRIGRYGLFSTLSQSVNTFREVSADYLVISYYLATDAVANYSVASFFPNIIRGFAPARMLSGVLIPIVTREYVNEGRNKIRVLQRMFSFLSNINMFLIFPMSAGILVMGDKIIQYIFEPRYMGVTMIMYVLVSTLLISNLADPYYVITTIIERKEIIFISSIWAIYNLIMDIILIPLYGIMGAAIATGSATIFNYLYLWFVYKYVMKIDLKVNYSTMRKMFVNTGIMTIGLLIFRPYINSTPMILVGILIGGMIYFISSYIIKAFPAEEREFINERINKKWFVF